MYAGPSLPHGRLKEHAVFNGTFEDVKAYLADVLEDYPQAERLIVPVERLSAFAAKVKTPGNIAHKYYNDIVSTMRGNKRYKRWQTIFTAFRRVRTTRRFLPL